ncbi:MAG: hypothetical protein RLZZ628_609 [Bacteroidota bacterium]|jgi:hypothetical protein
MKNQNYILWTIPASITIGVMIVVLCAGFKKPVPSLPIDPLRQEQVQNDILFSARFRPLSQVVAANEPRDSAEAAQIRQSSAPIQHFILEISPKGQGLFREKLLNRFSNETNPEQTAEKAMNYYRFEMAPDLKLVAGQDTLLCVMHHWEQTGNTFNGNRLLLGFADPRQRNAPAFDTDFVLLYREHVFSGQTLAFPFSRDALNATH